MEYQSRLRELRILSGITSQRELSKKLKDKGINISYTTIAGIEKGTGDPVWSSVANLAKYFNVSVDYLMGFSDSHAVGSARTPMQISQEVQSIVEEAMKEWLAKHEGL